MKKYTECLSAGDKIIDGGSDLHASEGPGIFRHPAERFPKGAASVLQLEYRHLFRVSCVIGSRGWARNGSQIQSRLDKEWGHTYSGA